MERLKNVYFQIYLCKSRSGRRSYQSKDSRLKSSGETPYQLSGGEYFFKRNREGRIEVYFESLKLRFC